MNLHLAEIATEIAPGKHAILLLDQAGWHLSSRLVVPPNITLVPLPAKCPELNPQENVWQFMRDNWLSNRVFKSYEDIVDHCCYAWNRLIDQPWRIMSIGMRDWAHRVLINESWYYALPAMYCTLRISISLVQSDGRLNEYERRNARKMPNLYPRRTIDDPPSPPQARSWPAAPA